MYLTVIKLLQGTTNMIAVTSVDGEGGRDEMGGGREGGMNEGGGREGL